MTQARETVTAISPLKVGDHAGYAQAMQQVPCRSPEPGRWGIAEVAIQREYAAAMALAGEGFEIYLPERRKPRRDGKSAVQRVESLGALWPGYLFVNFADVDAEAVRVAPLPSGKPAVRDLVCNTLSGRDVGLFRVPADEIRRLRVAIDAGAFDLGVPLKKGETVRVKAGKLAGATGRITEICDRYSLKTLVRFLGRDLEPVLETTDVERV